MLTGGNVSKPIMSSGVVPSCCQGSIWPRNAMIPALAQASFVPPAVHDCPIDPVRSSTIMMSAGCGAPPCIAAVDVAETLQFGSTPGKTLPSVKGSDADSVTVTAFCDGPPD